MTQGFNQSFAARQPATLGTGDITADAWGAQKMSLPYSLFHGLWTFDIPATMWFMYEGGTQVYTSTNIVSTSGAAVLTAQAGKTPLVLESRECPRYQPNRGHLFSSALWCPSKTADGVRDWGLRTTENGVFFRLKADGKLYAVRKSGGSEVAEEEIDTSGVTGFDVQKGNVYDIQYQWRGVGNYIFFINLTQVHTMSLLGTLTALSMQNPALPISFTATRTTADVAIHIGCADVTSENGADDAQQYGSAFGEAVATNGTDKPVLVISNPLQIGGKTNTRSVQVARISVINSKKSTFKVWLSRTLADVTGATFVANGGGSYVETDSPDMNAGAVTATAATVANMRFITAIAVEASSPRAWDVQLQNRIALKLVRGDYLVITSNATTGSSDVVCEWSEEV